MKVSAVIVTYNRLELLKKCVNAVRNQTRTPEEIIVVNNSSSDGTEEWLKSQDDLTVITQENSGSAGGQLTGIKTAFEKNADWIWCLDTDVIPYPNALEKLLTSSVAEEIDAGFLTGAIFYKDGNPAYINIPYVAGGYDVVTGFMKKGALPIVSASFGSVVFPRKVIEKVGFPIKSFFIWGDDVEYTMRIIENGYKGFLIRESSAVHHAPDNFEFPFENMSVKEFKTRYAVRNTVFTLILRNRVMGRNGIRVIPTLVKFLFNLLSKRKISSKRTHGESFYFIRYFIEGLFYNPRKNDNR